FSQRKWSGPTRRVPAGPLLSGTSTSAPGRGRALGRAAGYAAVATSERRLPRVVQAGGATGGAPAGGRPRTPRPGTHGKQRRGGRKAAHDEGHPARLRHQTGTT